jgi:hypothetical protein
LQRAGTQSKEKLKFNEEFYGCVALQVGATEIEVHLITLREIAAESGRVK